MRDSFILLAKSSEQAELLRRITSLSQVSPAVFVPEGKMVEASTERHAITEFIERLDHECGSGCRISLG